MRPAQRMATLANNMVNPYAIAISLAGVATGASGILVAQLPTETEIGELTKYGFAGGCLIVTGYLIIFLIPKILEVGKQINEGTRIAIEKGFAELGTKIDKGNESVTSLLQRALFNDRQTK